MTTIDAAGARMRYAADHIIMPSTKKKHDNKPDPQQMSYEDAIAELEAINERIEQGQIGLEESLDAYRRGVALAKRCETILDTAEQELKKIKPGRESDKSGGDD